MLVCTKSKVQSPSAITTATNKSTPSLPSISLFTTVAASSSWSMHRTGTSLFWLLFCWIFLLCASMPYECEQCGVGGFFGLNGLGVHQKRWCLKVKTFLCRCGETFPNNLVLKSHLDSSQNQACALDPSCYTNASSRLPVSRPHPIFRGSAYQPKRACGFNSSPIFPRPPPIVRQTPQVRYVCCQIETELARTRTETAGVDVCARWSWGPLSRFGIAVVTGSWGGNFCTSVLPQSWWPHRPITWISQNNTSSRCSEGSRELPLWRKSASHICAKAIHWDKAAIRRVCIPGYFAGSNTNFGESISVWCAMVCQ
jgi:hypothetical protein